MNSFFIGVNHDPLLIQHQDIHGQPFGGHPQWVVCKRNCCIFCPIACENILLPFSFKTSCWLKYKPSGIKGVGGFTTVQPAFLNMSIWGTEKKQTAKVNIVMTSIFLHPQEGSRGRCLKIPGDMGGQGLTTPNQVR